MKDPRALTIRLLGKQYGPVAEILIDDALTRAQMGAADLHSSKRYLQFLRVLEQELPSNPRSNHETVTRIWSAMADHFLSK